MLTDRTRRGRRETLAVYIHRWFPATCTVIYPWRRGKMPDIARLGYLDGRGKRKGGGA